MKLMLMSSIETRIHVKISDANNVVYHRRWKSCDDALLGLWGYVSPWAWCFKYMKLTTHSSTNASTVIKTI
jgi:hypothetical protein